MVHKTSLNMGGEITSIDALLRTRLQPADLESARKEIKAGVVDQFKRLVLNADTISRVNRRSKSLDEMLRYCFVPLGESTQDEKLMRVGFCTALYQEPERHPDESGIGMQALGNQVSPTALWRTDLKEYVRLSGNIQLPWVIETSRDTTQPNLNGPVVISPQEMYFSLFYNFGIGSKIKFLERFALLDPTSDTWARDFFNEVLNQSVKRHASDIKIGPYAGTDAEVRVQQDGVWYQIRKFPVAQLSKLVGYLKTNANLQIEERRKPQDGRLTIEGKGTEEHNKNLEFRISTGLDTPRGETATIRVLEKNPQLHTLEGLGYGPAFINGYAALLEQRQGCIIITGPTGHGKSTTLYAGLRHIRNVFGDSKNILTAEDPIEQILTGVWQSQVHERAEITYPRLLRSFLRQAPNVIMIGEMRDKETAQIGIQASLTGHLVLTTLHTNSAVEAVTRLLDMDVEDYKLAGTLLATAGQRLGRKICTACNHNQVGDITEDLPHMHDQKYFTHGEGQRLTTFFYTPDEKGKLFAERWFFGEGTDTVIKEHVLGLPFRKPVGKINERSCEDCGATGYRGRVAIAELMTVDKTLQECIYRVREADGSKNLYNAALNAGMVPMIIDGLRKAASGTTDIIDMTTIGDRKDFTRYQPQIRDAIKQLAKQA